MTKKKLGFGLMRLPLTDANNGGSIDLSKLEEMVDRFLERGFTYFDTAYLYCDGMSERAVKEVLTKRYPRDAFTVTSKLPSGELKTKEDRDRVFFHQLEKTGLSYFDYYLLHAVSGRCMETFEGLDCFSWIREKKAAGLAKHIGFSYHDGPELLDAILTKYPFFDYVQLQINYLDWESPSVQSRACYEVCCKHKKPVIVMEPVKGGMLANVPESVERMMRSNEPEMSPASWAVRFAAGLDNVYMVLSGMSTLEQVTDNTGFMAELKPLNPEQVKMLEFAAQIINGNIAVPCTGCAYCTERCPVNIATPQYFALYNAAQRGEETTGRYKALTEKFGKASACVGCGQCEKACPQQLPIRELLKKVSERFES